MRPQPALLRIAAIPVLMLAAVVAGCATTSSGSSSTGPNTVSVPTTQAQPITADTTPTTPTTSVPTTTTSTTAAGPADPCAVVTKEQIAAATGTTPTIAEPESDDRCNFGVVRTWVDFGEDWITSVASKGEAITGVGDAAAYDPEFHQIYVKAGDRTFNIQCTVCQGDQKEILTKLAHDAVANLG